MFIFIGGSDELLAGNQAVVSDEKKERILNYIIQEIADSNEGVDNVDIIVVGKTKCPYFERSVNYLREITDRFKSASLELNHKTMFDFKKKYGYEGKTPLVWVNSRKIEEFILGQKGLPKNKHRR